MDRSPPFRCAKVTHLILRPRVQTPRSVTSRCSYACPASLQGWEAARDHARSAVETDNRLRRWLPGPGLAPGPPAGLLYRCTLGNLDLTAPLGEAVAQSLSLW